jgi:hypothetical protein
MWRGSEAQGREAVGGLHQSARQTMTGPSTPYFVQRTAYNTTYNDEKVSMRFGRVL